MAKEKAGDQKHSLAEQLEDVAQYMEILGENDFKVRAFRKGADAVRSSESALDAIASGAVKVAGVGEGLKAAIHEFLSTGEVAARKELAAKVPPGVLELMRVPGLGPKKALHIQKELGVNSIGELEYACRENRLLKLKGFGTAVQEKILRAIEDLRNNEGKFRLDEATARAEALEKELRAHLGKNAEVIRVGALGRHSEIVEELELYFTGEMEKVADAITSLGWSGGLEERRESPFQAEIAGFSGELKDGTKLTLWVSESRPDERTLLWLCGAEPLRDELEAAPQRFDGFEPSWLETEWFDAERQPTRDTYRLTRDGSVKGVFHCHTDFSDGAATLEQMVKAAEGIGYQYIGISDHSQSAHYAQGLNPERIREQQKRIADLQKKVSIKIFHGIESDILKDGALDYDDDILAGFDFIVGSIHSRFKMAEEEMTRRITYALRSPFLTMWGHPTGRLILGRLGYGVNWAECLDVAAENKVAIEINANPHRLDVDWRLGAELERRGLNVCINPDAHDVEGLRDTVYGEYMAEKAMLPRGSILNLLSVNEMEKYLWQRKQRARH